MAAVRIQFRRGTETEWNTYNPVLSPGELGYESTNKKIKIGDGVKTWDILETAAAGDIYAIRVSNTSGLRYAYGTDGYGTASAGETGVVALEVDPTQVVMTSTFDSKGDTLVGTGEDTYTVLHIGDNGQSLIADSTQSTGVKWGTPVDPTISNGYINSNMLATGSVIEAKLASSAVTESKIGTSAVTATKIADGAVGTAKIIDANVTAAKLASNSVETAKINNLAVTTDKLAAASVTSAKIDSTVYYRASSGTSARIYIQPVGGSAPTGSTGDIWFAYE